MAEMTMQEAAAKLHALAQETVSEETPEEPEVTEESVETEETSEAVSEDQDVNQEEPSEEESEPEPIDQSEEENEPGAEAIELEADQFAEILKLKPEQLNVDDDGVKFRAKVNDEPVDVTLEQLINAYQGEATLTNRSKEIAERERLQQEHLQRLAEQSNQFAQQSATILENLKNKYVNPYDEAELKALREDDPAEYAARKQEIREREQEFKNLVHESLNTVQTSQSTQSEEMQRQYAEYLQAEQQKTLEKIPNWKEVEGDVASYALELGFTNEELGQIADHRLLNAFHKAMLFDKGKQGATKKKVRHVPKVMKGGNRPSKNQVSLEAAEQARQRLKQTGSIDDAVAALKATRRS